MVFTIGIAMIIKICLASALIGYVGCANKKKIKKGYKSIKRGIENYREERE